MFPYQNFEDLGKAQTLLLRLHSCRHYLLEVFVNVDFDSMHLGLASGIIHNDLMLRHIMFLPGQKTLKMYGKVLTLKELKKVEPLRRSCFNS